MADHGRLAPQVDQPIAGLLQDLKQRGMMDDVLVVWTTEFGRTPFNNTAECSGREHHNWAFTSWLAASGCQTWLCSRSDRRAWHSSRREARSRQ